VREQKHATTQPAAEQVQEAMRLLSRGSCADDDDGAGCELDSTQRHSQARLLQQHSHSATTCDMSTAQFEGELDRVFANSKKKQVAREQRVKYDRTGSIDLGVEEGEPLG
jgi:hypothetical protein